MNLQEIKKVIQKLVAKKYPNVSLVYIFGSYAKGNYNQSSDIDIAILFNKPKSKQQVFKNYLSFMADITKELRTENIDLVLLNTLEDPILLMEIVQHGKVIIDSKNESIMLDNKALNLYNDYLFLTKKYE